MRFVKSLALAALVALGAGGVQAQTALKVGSTPTGVPFTFLDARTNTIQGMMVDVIETIGKEAGFGVDIQPIAFSALIPSLTSGKIDVISAAMYGSPERRQIVDFSGDVYTYGEGLIVPKADATAYKTFADMKGKKVGAQLGTRYLDALKNSGAFSEVVAYDSLPDIMRDVGNGRLDMGVGDYPILAYNVAQGRFPQVSIVTSYVPSVVGSINIAVKKGEGALLAKIDASLARMKTDGRMDAILKKWGL